MSSSEEMENLNNVENRVRSSITTESSEGVTDVNNIANPSHSSGSTETYRERPNIILRQRTAERKEALRYPVLEREITEDGCQLTRGDKNNKNIRYKTQNLDGGFHLRKPDIPPNR